MANLKISQLPAATTLAGDTLLEVVQNGENKKATLNDIQTLTASSITAQRTALSINNVDNTSDANKPVSTAQQTALDGKAAISHTHTANQISDSTTAGRALLTAADAAAQRAALALGNVNNTSDANKPVSTAQQTALDGKANTSHTHTASQISDSTTAGRALLTAVDAAAQRTALALSPADFPSFASLTVAGSVLIADVGFQLSNAQGPAGDWPQVDFFNGINYLRFDRGLGRYTLTIGGNVRLSVDNTNFTVSSQNLNDSKGNVRDLPVTNRTAAYTAALSDTGGIIRITTGGVTIPSGVFSPSHAFSIMNNSGSNQTITQGAGVTLRLAGTGSTGNRTLAQYGLCTVTCVAANEFVISGAGLS